MQRAECHPDYDRRHFDLHPVTLTLTFDLHTVQRASQGRAGGLALRDTAVHVSSVLPQRTQQRGGSTQLSK